MNTVKNELWQDIPNYEGWYQVSTQGRIRRMKAGKRTFIGRISKGWLHASGYPVIKLYREGKYTTIFIHILVATAFIGKKPDGFQTNHIDGNRANNCIENLEWVTPLENVHHADYVLGNIHKRREKRGELSFNVKLTDKIVMQMRQLHREQGIGCWRLSKMFFISKTQAHRIIKGESWSHLPMSE